MSDTTAQEPTSTTALDKPAIGRKDTALLELLERKRLSLAEICPGGEAQARRIAKQCLVAVARDDKLRRCTPESVLLALMEVAELGLELSPALGHVALIGYSRKDGRTTCEARLMTRGLLHLARESGVEVEAHAVYEHDFFDYQLGSAVMINHKPAPLKEDRGELIGVYAIARMANGLPKFEVMSRADVEAVRATSRAANDGPWVQHFSEMARKTVVRRLMKYLEISPRMAAALDLDDRAALEVADVEPAQPDAGVEAARTLKAKIKARIEEKSAPVES